VKTTPWLNDSQLRAWKNLSLMQLQLSAQLSRELAAEGLSYQDYLVLASLSDQPDGRRRVVELGAELGWEKSRISHHITRMCERGLVEKERCPTDQRGSFVVLTDDGRRAVAAAAPGHVAAVRRLFLDLITPEQLGVINAVAATVLENLSSDD
jgi:DNA-binding MarR family transcriptional regulator